MQLFLSPRDLQQLTGAPQPAKQVLWLKRERFQYRLDMAGRPVVLVAEVENRMATPQPLWTVRKPMPEFDEL